MTCIALQQASATKGFRRWEKVSKCLEIKAKHQKKRFRKIGVRHPIYLKRVLFNSAAE
jgi:hypothetical protein